jgi:hypothetical protein
MSKPVDMDEYFTPFIKEIDFIMTKGGVNVETSTGDATSSNQNNSFYSNPAKSAATGTVDDTAKLINSDTRRQLHLSLLNLFHCHF